MEAMAFSDIQAKGRECTILVMVRTHCMARYLCEFREDRLVARCLLSHLHHHFAVQWQVDIHT